MFEAWGGPVRDLSEELLGTPVVVLFGAAEVVDAAFFLSKDFPAVVEAVVCPSLSVSWWLVMLAGGRSLVGESASTSRGDIGDVAASVMTCRYSCWREDRIW